jgi:hypothetical protein
VTIQRSPSYSTMGTPMPAVQFGHNRALKKPASFVLASLRPSTYPRGYASGSRSLRPRWTDFLNTLRILFSSLHMSEVSLKSGKSQQLTVVLL